MATFDVYNALQGFAQIGLLALAIGLTMMAGEFDLSVVGTYAVGGMIAVQAGQSSAVLGLLAAVAAGAAIGAVQGGLIAWLRIPSMPVTLAAYIALLGLAYVISGGLSVTFTNQAATLWVDQTVAGIFSPRSLITLGAFVLAAIVLGFTRLGPELRAIGGDRRAGRVAGVRVDRDLVAAVHHLRHAGGPRRRPARASASPRPTPIRGSGRCSSPRWPRCWAGCRWPAGGAPRPGCSPARSRWRCSPRSWPWPTCRTTRPSCSTRRCSPSIVAIDSPGLRRTVERVRARTGTMAA